MQTLARGNCGFCNSEHQHVSSIFENPALCVQCQACYRYCEHMEGCTWPDMPARGKVSSETRPNATAVANNVASKDLKDAFESWFTSSAYVSGESDDDVKLETVWSEFERFVKEILTPVDSSKTYLRLTMDGPSNNFEILDTSNLYKNQDGEYVIVSGKRRTRIGKTVAVMG